MEQGKQPKETNQKFDLSKFSLPDTPRGIVLKGLLTDFTPEQLASAHELVSRVWEHFPSIGPNFRDFSDDQQMAEIAALMVLVYQAEVKMEAMQ